MTDPAPKTTPAQPGSGSLLAAQLAAENTPKMTPLLALEEAKRLFAEGKRIDMGQFASAIDVSRATLYRWAGSREEFITEILWSFSRHLLSRAEARALEKAVPSGGAKVAEVFTGFIRLAIKNEPLQIFLAREPEFAFRLLTSSAGLYQARLIGYCRELIEHEMSESSWHPEAPTEELAYGVIRLGESYVYRPYITGEEADADSAAVLLKLLLR